MPVEVALGRRRSYNLAMPLRSLVWKRRAFVSGILAWVLVSAGGIAGCATSPLPEIPAVYERGAAFEPKARRVLIVSFDGLRPDAIEAAGAKHIQSLAAAGTRAKVARTVLPSITLVSHASMLSGVSPTKHKIFWNSYDSTKGTILVPTVFDLAKRAGLTTAMIVGKEKFRHLARPGTVDRFVFETGMPHEIALATKKAIEELKPELLFVHFPHPDQVGHKQGWMSSNQLRAIRDSDHALGEIFQVLREQSLFPSTTVILTADHGGSGRGHGEDSEVSKRIPWYAAGPGVVIGGEIEREITTYDTAATAAKLLALPIPAEWDGKPVF
jgi:predicted AlkP superfamily pyrophosphatase or phosphodiesterase